jgi:hypothetical protein
MPFYPDDVPVPAGLRTDEFLLRMLRAADVDLDFDAVMATQATLRRRTGDRWPREGFTRAENLADLEWHEAEFLGRRSFAYTVMNPAETECLGCVYVYPLAALLRHEGAGEEDIAPVGEREAGITFWVRDRCVAADLDRRLLAALLPWLRTEFPFSRVALGVVAADERQPALFREAGLGVMHAHTVRDTEFVLFA